MKRLFCIIISLILTISLFACSKAPETALEEQLPDGSLRKTVLYYSTQEGLIVPVMREIPWDEGIACSALSYLVSTEQNEQDAREHGLCTVIPEGTQFSLKISPERKAVLDVKNMPALPDEQTERIFLQSVVNTLTEFATIDTVSLTFDGKQTAVLPHNTRTDSEMNSFLLNPVNTETETIAQGSVNTVSLYIPDSTCRYSLPLVCYVPESANFETAMKRFCSCCAEKGITLPDNVSVISAALTDGTAVVNFSDELAEVTEYGEGIVDAIYKSVYLTACEYGKTDEVRIFIGGNAVSCDAEIPEYVNVW